ncbi:hypothetical protein [Lewinella cohaerens]|uniref:hypothetical protein n=1 Tax=Lewinella cohaerens TaxID=70995 RepID=UPI00037EEF89|nr:hypothetical protein [Lewinella cohaerens]
MNQKKLITLFQSLTAKDLRNLKKFVRSPYHNTREDVILLFDLLRSSPLEELNEERLFSALFPQKVFDKKELAYVLNYLMKVIEDYFAVQYLEANQEEREFAIAKEALARQQKNIFFRKVEKASKLLSVGGINTIESHQLKYELEMILCDQQMNEERGASLNLKQPSERLESIVIASILRQACSLLTHENISKTSYDYELLHHILPYLESPEKTHLVNQPVIALYYHSYKTLKEDDINHFQELKQMLIAFRASLSKRDLKNFYIISINFSIKQLNSGNGDYVREAFNLYQKALEDDVLLDHGVLSQFHYKNIAALGLGLKAYDWVEQFLIKYREKLKTQYQALNFNYNFAKLQYEKGEYEAALKLLQAVKYDESLPNLTSRILLMKIFYELDEREVLASYLNSFEGMVRRQRKLGYHKNSYLNLISFMRRMLHLNPYDNLARQKLRTAIENKNPLPEKKWLLTKL